MDAIAFQTRARTIDHLGREQIADCPTAISELWKNSYDAYAQNVALHIFDGEIPTAALVDDGHGMSREEFVRKWLVVGTESKIHDEVSPKDDRNGLPVRHSQGQKGIGRLSSAALGPLLLIVSKRKAAPFVAALIDWRLFENPYLYLQDIEIPITDFAEQATLLTVLPAMFEKLMGNVWGSGSNSERDLRIAQAWSRFDALNLQLGQPSIRAQIEATLVEANFGPRQLDTWPVWSQKSDRGTALFVAGVSFDLEAQLPGRKPDADQSLVEQAKERLFGTLSNFTDPFSHADDSPSDHLVLDFRYSVTAWEGGLSYPIISDERSFNYKNLEDLEHVLEGQVNKTGIFKGRVKAFGKWLDCDITVNPESPVPTRADSVIGPFHLRLGTFEQVELNSSHPPEIHAKLVEQAERYAGFMVYRNGLRVMPYGREDNDFFEIEKRRSLSAGREFWSNRRLFGRLALTRESNPNLKDKAGREGIIDNKAAKAFRDLVENILMTTARRFFGSASPVRQDLLPAIQKTREEERAQEAEKKIRARKRKEFREKLESGLAPIRTIRAELEDIASKAREGDLPSDEAGLVGLRDRVLGLRQERASLSLGKAPTNLGTLEKDYREFRTQFLAAGDLITTIIASLNAAIERVKPQTQRDIDYAALSRNAVYLQDKLRKWSAEARQLLSNEVSRVAAAVDDRNKRYHAATLSLLQDLEDLRLSVGQVLEKLEAERERQDEDNADFFLPYISSLRNLQESVDLEALVSVKIEDSDKERNEITRLNSLAQLGITVEIVGHEIEGLDMTISEGLKGLAPWVRGNPLFDSVKKAHDELTQRLRFLSPLKLSGERQFANITGGEIHRYVSEFLGKTLDARGIDLDVSNAFTRFSVFEDPARVLPVFINLVNNAAYWVGQTRYLEKHIRLDVVDERVIVADDGPGVDPDDVGSLFTLFFTRKVRGGRGVGLYLCRANLAVGGHTISYITDPSKKRLSGANFVIDFKGAHYE